MSAQRRILAVPKRCRSGFVFMMAGMILLATACEDTQAPRVDPDEDVFSGSFDPEAGVMRFALESSSGEILPIELVATDVVHDDSAGVTSARVALVNHGLESMPGPRGVLVRRFVPPDVHPLNADCPVPEVVDGCVFDYTGTYGGDGTLDPGESSAPVTWRLRNPRGGGFSFQARLLPATPPGGVIAGVVFEDLNANGQHEVGEPGIADAVVSLERGGVTLIRRTDAQGRYRFTVDAPGLYPLDVLVRDGWAPTTPTEVRVAVFRRADGSLSNFLHGDFGCRREVPPPGPFAVVGHVYRDLNRNGRMDPGEPGRPDVGLSLFGLPCAGFPQAPFLETHSGPDGRYAFPMPGIPCPLPWVLLRARVTGFVEELWGTTPARAVIQRSPRDSAGVVRIDFGLAPPDPNDPRVWLLVEGDVFLDRDGNGQRDATEPGVLGVPLQLVSPCDVLLETFSDPRGAYFFEPLDTGMCPIEGVFLAAPDFEVTTPNPVFFPPPGTPGIHLQRADFGIRPLPVPASPPGS